MRPVAAGPRVTVKLGPTVPGWALRALFLLVVLGCGLLTSAGVPGLVVLLGLAGVAVVRTGGVLPAVVAVLLAVFALPGSAAPFEARGFVLLAGLHLVMQLGATFGRTRWDARFELRALGVVGRRYLVVQVVSQVLALLAAVVTQGQLQAAWFPPLAVVALALLVVWLLARLEGPV